MEILNFISNKHIDYYYFDINEQPINNIKQRSKELKIIDTNCIFSDEKDRLIFKDLAKGNEVNIINGHRITLGNPKEYKNTIYVFGVCISFGAFATDDKTIESFLQHIININDYSYRVVNYASPSGCGSEGSDLNQLYTLMSTSFKEGDIIIHFGLTLWKDLINLPAHRYCSLAQIFNNPPYDKIACFCDDCNPAHIDETGNKVIAEVIFNRIKGSLISDKPLKPFFSRIDREVKIDKDLQKYLEFLSKEKVSAKNIGAVVMNCNPFTKGHMYLIEQALNQVDFLYVFVVEEDLSEFSFKDRFAIVQKNCNKFSNIKVLPSGRYMISTFTFAEYFKKDALQNDNKIMPAKDVHIFGSAISPCLNIKTRFVGEEPLDNVTRQYNEALKEILVKYGVELVEIPRCKLPSGEIINATKVRKLIKEGKMQECGQYLTKETYNYIIDKKITEGVDVNADTDGYS